MAKMTPTSPPVDQAVRVDYTNYKGERRVRRVIPTGKMTFSTGNKHHPAPQWLMEVYDLDKGEFRSYALTGIHGIVGGAG